MDWHRLEKWVTISFGIAAGIAVAIQLAKTFLPEGWWLQRLAQDVVEYLDELGDIGSGAIIIVFLIIFGGNRIMTVLLRGIEKLQEMREERRRIREEAREEGHEEGRKAGREEGRKAGREEGRREERANLRARLEKMGYDPDEILPSEEGESEDGPNDGG